MKNIDSQNAFSQKQIPNFQESSVSFKSERMQKDDMREDNKLHKQLQYQDSRHQITALNMKASNTILEKENMMLKMQLQSKDQQPKMTNSLKSTSDSFIKNLIEGHKLPDKPCLPESPSIMSVQGVQPQFVMDVQTKKDQELIKTYKLQINHLLEKVKKLEKDLKYKEETLLQLQQNNQLNSILNKRLYSLQRKTGEDQAKLAVLEASVKSKEAELNLIKEQLQFTQKNLKNGAELSANMLQQKYQQIIDQLQKDLSQSIEQRNNLQRKNQELIEQTQLSQSNFKLTSSKLEDSQTSNNYYVNQVQQLQQQINTQKQEISLYSSQKTTCQQEKLQLQEYIQQLEQLNQQQLTVALSKLKNQKKQSLFLLLLIICSCILFITQYINKR